MFLPDKAIQTQIVEAISAVQNRVTMTRTELLEKLNVLDQITLTAMTPEALAEAFPEQPCD